MKRIIPIIILIIYSVLSKNTYAQKFTSLDSTKWLKPVKIKRPTFTKLFGGNTIEIIPRGNIDFSLANQYNRLDNPFINEKNRKQWGIEFDQNVNLSLSGKIGERALLRANFNSQAQFDFENQLRFEYQGKDEDIIKRIEIGNVHMSLNTSFIQGSESLYGIKTQMEYGKFNFTGIFAQKKSTNKEIVLNNDSQQGNINISMGDYEANQHYFLSQYFRNNYNKSLRTIPFINSQIHITQIEVWVSNKSSNSIDSRNILALTDLAESNPYNPNINKTSNLDIPSSGIKGQSANEISNDLLQLLGESGRMIHSTNIQNFFLNYGDKDNYAKIIAARKLVENQDYRVHRQLGYISLHHPLDQDQILAISFRYYYKGKEYQVGDLSSDIPISSDKPKYLYCKLLKNDILKTNLPIWDLMMKNIYRLQASNISKQNFNIEILRKDEHTASESAILYEGQQSQSKTWLELTYLDRISENQAQSIDGQFDWVDNVTIDISSGKLIFPVVEPLGNDLAANFMESELDLINKYTFKELYTLAKNDAIQNYPNKNRFRILGKFTSKANNEFYLGTINIRPEAIKVYSDGRILQEGADYLIDYDVGTLRLLNPILQTLGHTIKVSIDEEKIYGSQQKTLFGGRLEYFANPYLKLGASFMHLTEKPISHKLTLGNEAVSNSMFGIDINFNKQPKWLNQLVSKIPYVNSNESSQINFYGEFAVLNPSKNNTSSYIDDFESNFTYIDIKSQTGWSLASTPKQFNESHLNNQLEYGYNRALLALYTIDPIFYQSSAIKFTIDHKYLIDHRSRSISEKEVFPFKEVRRGTGASLSTLDLAFYPMIRGPYNYNSYEMQPDGKLSNPKQKWAGMFKKIEQIDFESTNIDYLEMWIMDPSLTNPNKDGGDLYINLGNISEDILKDGHKSVENALPIHPNIDAIDQTAWGKVAKHHPISSTFQNTEQNLKLQDIGLDGLTNEEEKQFFSSFLTTVQSKLQPEHFEKLIQDPSSDDYVHYRGNHFDRATSILERYKYINGTEGNTRSPHQSKEDFDVKLSARTLAPDTEDINKDNMMNETDEYYQYRFSTRHQDLIVGRNFIVDEQNSTIQISNRNVNVKWYKIRIPLTDYESKEGNIKDFKTIRFIRLFLTNYSDTAILRFAKMQFVKGDWRKYNAENNVEKTISDPSLGRVPPDNSEFYIANINLEENGTRSPIPYLVPKGIHREIDYQNNNLAIQQNEQSLSLQVFNLKDGYGRSTYKTAQHDLRSYGGLELYVHAEGELLKNGDATAFVRIGTDDKHHYYEYEKSLMITEDGASSPNEIWPEQNILTIKLNYFNEAKIARDKATINGLPWPLDIPFEYTVNDYKITILGSPDLSSVRFYMMGIKNPLRKSSLSHTFDHGSPISGEFWFNEFRLTDLHHQAGWGTNTRLNIKLADLANIAITASRSTIGFGSLSQHITERSRANSLSYNITTSLELGKFFHPRHSLSIPLYFNLSKQIETPEYNPLHPDVKLDYALSILTNNKRDSLLKIVRDYSQRKSFSLTNVRKMKTIDSDKIKPWNIENIGLTFGYSELTHRDYYTRNNHQYNYRAVIDYYYSNPKQNFKQPFKKLSHNHLAIIQDFSYNLVPSFLNFRVEINRIYRENTFRNNSNDNTLPTYYNKNFNMNRIYGISWDLTKSLRLDFNASNYAIIDEPHGRIDGAKIDTLWNNFWKLGRTTDYGHMMNITYTLPINKLPHLDWISISTRYGSQFNWQSEPINTLKNEAINLGNSIQNNRTIQVNPTLNFNVLYNKFRFIRNNKGRNAKGTKAFLIQLLTSIRHFNSAYTKTEGTYLPSYIPKTKFIGMDLNYNAPGIDFIFGGQADILSRAIQHDWLSKDSLTNTTIVRTLSENISGIINAEPLKDLKIDLTFSKIHNYNTSTRIHFNTSSSNFEQNKPYLTGNYTITQIALPSSFRKTQNLIQEFYQRKKDVSSILAENNINSVGIMKDFYADGFGKEQQDVIINAFLNTFYKTNSVSLNRRPQVPMPNWRLNYNGLVRLISIEDIIQSIHIIHAYQSQYIISAYHSNSLFQEYNGMQISRDHNNNFRSKEQYSSITITDRFSPLIGIDVRLKNSLSINGEYRQAKDMNLNLQTNSFVDFEETSFVLGAAYRKNNIQLPFQWLQSKKWKNDINFKVDLAMNHRKTSVYRAENIFAEVTAGNKSLTVNPSLDYTINRYYTIRLFYNSNLVQPYTSSSFATAYTYFGINLRFQFQ